MTSVSDGTTAPWQPEDLQTDPVCAIDACASEILHMRAYFSLLRSIQHYFHLALPTVDSLHLEICHDEPLSNADEDDMMGDLKNDITLLRNDMEVLRKATREMDITQITNTAYISQLTRTFSSLLQLFEGSIIGLEIEMDLVTSQDVSCEGLFPNLLMLRALGRREIAREGHSLLEVDEPSLETRTHLITQNVVSSFIKFPPPDQTLAECVKTIRDAGNSLFDVLDSIPSGRWSAESQLAKELTSTEIDKIKDADAFSEASKSLFDLLVNCAVCKQEHTARLHLSGFRAGQLEMSLSTRSCNWVPVKFTHSSKPASSEQKMQEKLCAHFVATECDRRNIRGLFDKTAVWEECIPPFMDSECMKTITLSPEGLENCFMAKPLQWNDANLSKRDRQVVRLFLAWSLFRLCGSSWLQYASDVETVFQISRKPLVTTDEFHLLPHCDLIPISPPRSLEDSSAFAEDVAALGVLILELEVNKLAGWKQADEDFETMMRSNNVRLRRLLQEWKDDLSDFHRGLADACLRFERLVEEFPHPDISQSSRILAVLYRCILFPLYKDLVCNFSATEVYFKGEFSVPVIQKRTEALGLVTLYDDDERSSPNEKSRSAEAVMKLLEDDFVSKIRSLRKGLGSDLQARSKKLRNPERIRIAILDTGVDIDDDLIRGARDRIKKKISFVDDDSDKWSDTHGHGTHVTRLLLTMAPGADILVAKITNNKEINPHDLSRIVKAIEWAIKEKVHIISMSFGYWTQNDDIDDAIENASNAKILLFAAASNVGGNRSTGNGRAHPSRGPNVFCIHACDGYGNKGDMNPSPERQKVNWTTLGIDIKSEWHDKTVYKSGTSFATPIAAAFAASVLEFANFKCDLEDRHKKYRQAGMVKIFSAMSTLRDGYDYILPMNLWNGRDERSVVDVIWTALSGQ